MLRRFAPYWESVRERWDGLSQNRRVAIVAVGLAALFTVALLLLLQPPQQYAPLFTGLSADDAAAIIDQLRQQGVPYKLSNDGTTISVPVEQVAKLRLALAAQGLPKSGTLGFELFDRSSFGVTDFQQRVNYQRPSRASWRGRSASWTVSGRRVSIWLYRKSRSSASSNSRRRLQWCCSSSRVAG
jgi:flagellar M-ring protein FliF